MKPARKRYSPNAPICPECTGRVIHYRSKTNDMVCRRCGYSGPRAKFFKKQKDLTS